MRKCDNIYSAQRFANDLSAFFGNAVEFHGVTIGLNNLDITVVSVYVRPVSQHVWDPRELITVRRSCKDIIILYEDFYAYNSSWGSSNEYTRCHPP